MKQEKISETRREAYETRGEIKTKREISETRRKIKENYVKHRNFSEIFETRSRKAEALPFYPHNETIRVEHFDMK